MPPSVAIVGAGLCGLTAAHRLREQGCDVVVFESEEHVGGRTHTVRRDGFSADAGASAVGSTYNAYLALTEELGLDLVRLPPHVGIHREGTTHLLDLRHVLLSGLRTRLLSPVAKARTLRLGVDVGLARARGQLDFRDLRKAEPLDRETTRAYAERALGTELASYLCEPIVRTMAIADADEVSRFDLFVSVANIFSSHLLALAGGQAALAERLAEGGDVRRSTAVEEVREADGAVRVTHAGGAEVFDRCIVTCPAPVAAQLCPDKRDELGALNRVLGYTSCLSVAVATRHQPACPAFLVQFPAVEEPELGLIFLEHNKAADRAPAGRGLLSCMWETKASQARMNASDDEIGERTVAAVHRTFPDLGDAIEHIDVTRWHHALPLTRVGSYGQMGAFAAAQPRDAAIQLTGDYVSGTGQNAAIAGGQRAARRLLNPKGRTTT